ncbi:hypothetical protein F2P81_010312 [Scophthalmus maximus]|uniref:Uncharacterized protein n=1 Tax=Scophthalmus maximus TaxID=52904 RepID=A0A6A4SZH4_SCOMX|nr:hypothetical protein F2P81_010312 [Scophthalmus maximus]
MDQSNWTVRFTLGQSRALCAYECAHASIEQRGGLALSRQFILKVKKIPTVSQKLVKQKQKKPNGLNSSSPFSLFIYGKN